MTNKSPKEILGQQLDRLKLDDDLQYMVLEGLRKISDEEASKLAIKLKNALEAFPRIIKEVIMELTKVGKPG